MPGTANEETDGKKGIKCVSIGSGPAGRWLVVVEYENNFVVSASINSSLANGGILEIPLEAVQKSGSRYVSCCILRQSCPFEEQRRRIK